MQPTPSLAAALPSPTPQGRYSIADIASAAPSSVPAPEGWQAGPAPVAPGGEVTPICDSKALIQPASGSELGGKWRGGLGRLKIVNGTPRDAVAVLIDSATQVPRRAIYVRSGES